MQNKKKSSKQQTVPDSFPPTTVLFFFLTGRKKPFLLGNLRVLATPPPGCCKTINPVLTETRIMAFKLNSIENKIRAYRLTFLNLKLELFALQCFSCHISFPEILLYCYFMGFFCIFSVSPPFII